MVDILNDSRIREYLRQSWDNSEVGTDNAHEEGGFVLRAEDGALAVERWPRGLRNEMEVPEHPGGRRNGLLIIASFHTHPNPGPEYQQEPSLTDIRAVRSDPDLRHPEFEGEYVISSEIVYRILPSGIVEELGPTLELLPST